MLKMDINISNASAFTSTDWDIVDQKNPDRAGRRFDGGAAAVSGGARSAMELPDPMAKQMEGTVKKIIQMLSDRQQESPLGGIYIVAPPTLLGLLRQKLDGELRVIVVRELAKDLAEMSLKDIQKTLLKALQ